MKTTSKPKSSRLCGALGLALGLATASQVSHAGDAVSDAGAQAVAQQILNDYKKEREKNIPRWSSLAHDEGQGQTVDCPVPQAANGQAQTRRAVSFKDCNLAYFELREERWQETLQSWAVLTPEQKSKLNPQVNAVFESLNEWKSTSMGSQTAKKGYAGGAGLIGAGGGRGGLMGLIGALGLAEDDATLRTITTMLDGSFLKGKPEALLKSLSFQSAEDLQRLTADINAISAQSKGHDGKGFNTQPLRDHMQLMKQDVDTQKAALVQTSNLASNSRGRADAVKNITQKIQALGASGEDASLVSGQLAQYEFYLSALDALGREEQIKAAAHSQGEQAQERLKHLSSHASLTEKNIKRALGK